MYYNGPTLHPSRRQPNKNHNDPVFAPTDHPDLTSREATAHLSHQQGVDCMVHSIQAKMPQIVWEDCSWFGSHATFQFGILACRAQPEPNGFLAGWGLERSGVSIARGAWPYSIAMPWLHLPVTCQHCLARATGNGSTEL